MNINDLTIGQVKELQKIFGSKNTNGLPEDHPYELGKPYFIRTVTHYYAGRLVAVYAQELVLEDAAWIADTGRFSETVATGAFYDDDRSEIEPFNASKKVIIGRGAVIDAVQCDVSLPMAVK